MDAFDGVAEGNIDAMRLPMMGEDTAAFRRGVKANDGRIMVYDGRNLAAGAVRMVSGCFCCFCSCLFRSFPAAETLFFLPFSGIQSALLAGVREAIIFKILRNFGSKRRIISKQEQGQGRGHGGRTMGYVMC